MPFFIPQIFKTVIELITMCFMIYMKHMIILCSTNCKKKKQRLVILCILTGFSFISNIVNLKWKCKVDLANFINPIFFAISKLNL